MLPSQCRVGEGCTPWQYVMAAYCCHVYSGWPDSPVAQCFRAQNLANGVSARCKDALAGCIPL